MLLAAVRPDLDGVAREAWRDDLLINSGLLRNFDEQNAEFLHLSFQEFLAAVRIKWEYPFSDDPGPIGSVFERRAGEARWHNTLTFLFAAQLANNAPPHGAVSLAEHLIDETASQPPADVIGLLVVLAECLHILTGKFPNALSVERKTQFSERCLLAIAEEAPVKERAALGIILGKLGDPRLVEDLRDHSAKSANGTSAFVPIPADTYLLGDEKQPWKLDDPFLLSRFPVTNGQYALFMQPSAEFPHGGYDDRRLWSEEGWAWLQNELVNEGLPLEPSNWRSALRNNSSQPVVGVCWFEAEAFARWAGGFLPREKQWEAAARGAQGLEYPWGDDPPAKDSAQPICNYDQADLGVTSAVGLFPRSRSQAFGLEDMGGNVWEWCADWYDESAAFRVHRGGSWCDAARSCRSADRDWCVPGFRCRFLGFRVAAVQSSSK